MASLPENIKVNRHLSDAAMDHIDHALGRPLWPLKDTFRNNFAIDTDSELARDFDASPHWRHVAATAGMSFYAVTSEGRAALGRHLRETSKVRGWRVAYGGFTRVIPAETASKARYAYYLEIADCIAESFGEFAKHVSVRAA